MAQKSQHTDLPRSEATARERLLEAATDIFGRHGYDGATTRMIAREAGVNIAAIPYYFNGKEGLYLAVIDTVVALIAEQLAPVRRTIAFTDFTGPEAGSQAFSLLEQLMSSMIGFMVGSTEAPRVSRIILREQLYPSAAYDRIFSGVMASALEALTTLIMVITGTNSVRTSRIRAMTLIGQVLVFRVARETVVRALDMEGYSSAETEEIEQIILEHTRALLTAIRRD